MRGLKDAIKDLEEMMKMKEESNKLLTASLDNNKQMDPDNRKLFQMMSREIIFLKDRYSSLLKKYMKLDLGQNFIKSFHNDIQPLVDRARKEYVEKAEKLMEENNKLKKTLAALEDKKKITLSQGKRRVLATDPDEAFVILTAGNDHMRKEVNELKAELSMVKKQKEDLVNENLQVKAELFRLASLVKAQFYGSAKQNAFNLKQHRETDSQLVEGSKMGEESLNWGSYLEPELKDELKLPTFKLDLDGFPGVVPKDREIVLGKGPSEAIFAQPQATAGEPRIYSDPLISRLIRNYHRALYHNKLLIEAFSKTHEMLKAQKQDAKKQQLRIRKKSVSSVDRRKIKSKYPTTAAPNAKFSKMTKITLAESKKLLKMISGQMKSYFEKIVQRIISPCAFVRIDERDVPCLTVRLQRAVSSHI